jgi:serine/threonine-protein kinase RsbW
VLAEKTTSNFGSLEIFKQNELECLQLQDPDLLELNGPFASLVRGLPETHMPPDPMPRCEFETRNLILRLETIIPAEIDEVSPVVDRVMDLVRQMKCAAGKEMEVETALREALANAIVHGCKNDPSKKVQFCVACDEERGMLIIVRSPGEGFDPTSIPNPTLGENIYSAHGRGIFLINQLMDEVKFKDGGTEIFMRIK